MKKLHTHRRGHGSSTLLIHYLDQEKGKTKEGDILDKQRCVMMSKTDKDEWAQIPEVTSLTEGWVCWVNM